MSHTCVGPPAEALDSACPDVKNQERDMATDPKVVGHLTVVSRDLKSPEL